MGYCGSHPYFKSVSLKALLCFHSNLVVVSMKHTMGFQRNSEALALSDAAALLTMSVSLSVRGERGGGGIASCKILHTQLDACNAIHSEGATRICWKLCRAGLSPYHLYHASQSQPVGERVEPL